MEKLLKHPWAHPCVHPCVHPNTHYLQVASKVVLLSFGSKSIKGIDPPLTLNFTKEDPEEYDAGTQTLSFKCTYYEKGKTQNEPNRPIQLDKKYL